MVAAGGVAAVDRDRLAADERRVGRQQERGDGGDLVGPAEAAQRVLLDVSSRRGSSMPSIPKMPSVIGVSMKPGQMALARMPRGP